MEARCRTTAMGIMPHTDVDRALELALSLDIPFWPQLPNVSFYEDMYAQTSVNLPGVEVDLGDQRVNFDSSRFEVELADYSEKMVEAQTFALSLDHSVVYHQFLSLDLSGYAAIRGQLTGPVSFGFKIVDENMKPIIYNEEVKTILFDFIQRKANVQYRELKAKNDNAFVWVDEPGLGWVFSGLSGYDDIRAKRDYEAFIAGLEGPKALHLCANVNPPYLLELGLDILSFDAYQIEFLPKGYTATMAEFLKAGGIISWGIVPTDSDSLGGESVESLAQRLLGYWAVLSENSGIPLRLIAEQALLAPARCCLKNIGQVGAADDLVCAPTGKNGSHSVEEILVEQAFTHLGELSQSLKDEFDL